MAYQTPYPDVHLNTRAIANYNNPMFDVLRSGLGWLENQEQKIADRKKAELLKQIQSEDMIDRYTQAKNDKQNLAKQLYGDSYFINSSDADLDKAMEALKTKESNRMLETVGRDIVSKVNQDVYKAGNEQDLLSSLGFNNRSQKELNDIRDFAQQQLKSRYDPYIQGKLADREVLEGKINEDDIDSIVNSFKERYGMDVNPALYYNSEKRKDYRKSALNSKLQQITSQLYGKQITPEQAIDQYRLLSLINSDFAEGINSQAQVVQSYADKQYEQQVADMLADARDDFRDELGNVDNRGLVRFVWNEGLRLGIPASTMRKAISAMYPQQGGSEAYSRANRRLAAAKQRKKDFDDKYRYVFDKPSAELTDAIRNNKDFFTNAKNIFSGLILTPEFNKLGIHDDDFENFLKFVYENNRFIPTSTQTNLKSTFENALKSFARIKKDSEINNNDVINEMLNLDSIDPWSDMYGG